MLSQKVSHFSHYIVESSTFNILSQKVVFFRLSQHFSIVFVNHVFTHTGTQLYLLTMSFSHSLQTNRHLGARQTQIEEATKFNTRQYSKTLRVEFTLTKLQEDLLEQESSRQITRAHKILTKQRKRNTLNFRQSQPGRSTCQGSTKSHLN